MTLTANALAELTKAELIGPGDKVIKRVDTAADADADTLVFVRNHKFVEGVAACAAGVVLIDRDTPLDKPDAAILRVDNVDLALNTVLEQLAPAATAFEPGIHPTAIIDTSAEIGLGVHIGPHCIVGAGARVGDGTVLIAQIYIGNNATIGRGCTVHPGVRFLERCVCGDGCIIHANAVIGADGFGYIPAPDGMGLLKVPQIGTVEIGNGVEIGANACIDRAKFGSTTIGDGTKIDNLVQIGHNARTGRACIICGQGGLAGSASIGDGVVLGGRAGVSDNSSLVAGVALGGGSIAMGNISKPGQYLGLPARPAKETAAGLALIHKLPQFKSRIKAIERALDTQGIEVKKPRH